MKEYIIAASVLAVAYLGLKMRCVRQMLHRHPRQPVTYVPFDSIPSTKTLPEIVRRYYSVIAPDGMIPVVSTFAFAGTAHVKVCCDYQRHHFDVGDASRNSSVVCIQHYSNEGDEA